MKNILFSLLVILHIMGSYAQTGNSDLSRIIISQDSLFWRAYNSCDVPGIRRFLAADLEFYHDRSGLTAGADTLSALMAKNLCGISDFKLRREAVPGTVKVYPLKNNSGIYGAIISGEHLFYIKQAGKEEYADGLAKFTHLWLNKGGNWVMSRILSYDHGPVER